MGTARGTLSRLQCRWHRCFHSFSSVGVFNTCLIIYNLTRMSRAAGQGVLGSECMLSELSAFQGLNQARQMHEDGDSGPIRRVFDPVCARL